MSGLHTILDTKRFNSNDDQDAYSAADVKIEAILMARYHALSFLGERGELTSVKRS